MGTTVTVAVEGAGLEGLSALRFDNSAITAEKKAASQQFQVTIPPGTPPGLYDARAIGTYGGSAPRAFVVSRLTEQVEAEPNNAVDVAGQAVLNAAINGRIDKPGDIDCFQFAARAGQHIVLECWAERIDSPLRAVLELYDAAGRRMAVNRGYAGLDPRVEFQAPADGAYVVKIFELTFAGGGTHFYRLDIDAGPRADFAFPPVVQRGKTVGMAECDVVDGDDRLIAKATSTCLALRGEAAEGR